MSEAGVPLNMTVLKLGRCTDCKRFSQAQGGDHVCASMIGGTRVNWGTGVCTCEPQPEAWHYCRDYIGPSADDVFTLPGQATTPGPREGVPVVY